MIGLAALLKGVPMWIYMAAVFAGGTLYYGNYERDVGEEFIQAKWNQYKVEQDIAAKNREIAAKDAMTAAVAKQIASNLSLQKQQEADHKKQVKVYVDHIAKHMPKIANARAAIINSGGLRLPNSACPSSTASGGAVAGGAKTADAGSGNGADSTFKLPDRIESDLLGLATRAEVEGIRCEAKVKAAQQFARDNGFD